MGQYAAGAISAPEIRALLSEASHARTIGRLRWRSLPVQIRAEVEVSTDLETIPDALILMSIPRRRQWEINFVYLVRAVPVRRVDVNSKHNGWAIGTHQHQYRPADGSESCEELEGFPAPQIQPLVEADALREAFLGFARLCHVEVRDTCWTEPDWG